MKSTLSIALLVGALTLIAHPMVASAEFRVAVVDVNRVLNSSPDAEAKKKRIDEMSKAAQEKLDKRKAELQKVQEKLKASKADEDSPEVEAFRTQAAEFEKMAQDSQSDIRKEFMRSNKELTDRTYDQIRTYAKASGYDIVFDKGDGQRGPVLFSGSIPDITEQVLKQSK